LTIAKSLRLKLAKLFLLLVFSWLVISFAVNDIGRVYGISESSAPITLGLDRTDTYYLLNIPSNADDGLSFAWVVKVDENNSAQDAILQFSSDRQSWSNLAKIQITDHGAESAQPIDSTWAITGKNFLRVVIGSEISNTAELTVHVGSWSWIVAGCVGLFFIIIMLQYAKRRISVKIPKWLSEKRKRIALLGIGLLILVALAPWTEQRFDNYVNRLWGSAVYQYSFLPFSPNIPNDYPLALRYSYPPVWLYTILTLFPAWLAKSGFTFPADPASLWRHGVEVNNVYESYRSFVPQTLPALDLLLKLPNIFASIGIALVISKFTNDSKQKNAILLMWIFNPFIICISAVWGLADALCTFFASVSIYLLWKKRNLLSSLLLALAIATKLYPVFFIVPILIYLLKNQGRNACIKFFIFSLAFSALVFGSFFIFPGGFEFVYALFFFKASPDYMGQNLFGGMTWMYVLSFFDWKGNLPIFPLIFVPLYIGTNYLFWKRKIDFDSLIACLTCTVLLSYLSYTVVNVQYILWVLPFLLYLTIKGKYPKKLYVVLSLIPLIFIFSAFNPLSLVSPAIVWNENNCPPLSDIVQQLWPVFSGTTISILIRLFLFVTVLSFAILQSKSFSESTHHLWEKGYSELMIKCRRMKDRISITKPK
jgi:GPI transamidase subunit PIG-U